MKDGGRFQMCVVVLLEVGETCGTRTKQHHGWKEDAECVAPMEREDKSKPVFRVVGDHTATEYPSRRLITIHAESSVI